MTTQPDDEAVKRLALELCGAATGRCTCRNAQCKEACREHRAVARCAIELGAVPPPAPSDPVDDLAEEIWNIHRTSNGNSIRDIAAYVHARFARKEG